MIDLFFVYTRFDDNIEQENELIQNDGRNIARQIATDSEIHLISGKDQQIQTRLDQAIEADPVIYASIYDQQG